MKKIVLLIVFSFAYIQFAFPQRIDRSKFVKDSLDNYINRALTNWRIPGAAVCIVKDGKVIMMKAYGIKELGQPEKVDVNTLFMIGSNTKAFTATALAMLQDRGKLSLDDKVTKYLPQFKLEDQLAGQSVVIRDLLCHRIGMRTFQGDFTFYNTNLTRDEIILKLGQLKAPYPFRTKWGYTNAAFLTAGQIIPAVTGQPWEQYIKDNIFAPLGMSNTLALTSEMPKSLNRTVPHTLIDNRLSAIPYCQIDGLAPAGGICSSISDMSKWAMAQAQDGKVGARQVIPLGAVKATREAQDIVGQVKHLDGETNFELYGLGWFIQNYAGHELIMHDGGVNGYVSSVTLVPDQHLGIVILTNTDQNQLFDALRWEIMEAYFNRPFLNYSDNYLAKYHANAAIEINADRLKKDTLALLPKAAMPLSNYTGKYLNSLYGNLTITEGENNDLEGRFEHHTHMFVHLQPLGGNRFYATFSDPDLGKAVFPFFVQNGLVTGVRVKVANFVEYDPYDFRKLP